MFTGMNWILRLSNLFFCIPGDARLAKSVKNKVFSFDLISNDPSVISCDMANVCAFIELIDMFHTPATIYKKNSGS